MTGTDGSATPPWGPKPLGFHDDGRPRAPQPHDGETVEILKWDDEYLVRRIEKSAGDLTYHRIRVDRYKPGRPDNWEIVCEVRERVLADAHKGLGIAVEQLGDDNDG